MSILPIVHRELGLASRRWTTFLIRGGVGVVAIILAVPGLFFGWISGGSSGAGQGAFATLSSYIFVVAMAGGLFITADCLSSEKREGTLGLLFLTDLRGYDVVLGKFAALGLHAMYGMLAVFPVLALPLLSGGVTGGEFWRVSLALLNLLFVSLSVGVVVSAASREAARAFFVTLLLMLLLVALVPLGLSLLTRFGGAPDWVSSLAWVSPAHAFSVGRSGSSQIDPNEYWISLGASHLLAWAFLILASVIVPHSWQDKEERRDKPTLMSRLVGNRVAGVFRAQRSPSWLDRNPMVWLMGDRPGLKILLWSIAGVWSVIVVACCVLMRVEHVAGIVFAWSCAILLIFAVILVEHSCRFWVESRQSGNLEVMLAVPLASRQILSSHWASIRRHFLWPLVVVVCLTTLPAWLMVAQALMKGDTDGGQLFGGIVLYIYMGVILLWFLSTFIAIGYTGMWFALKLRRPHFASGLTVLCVIVLPMMFCWLGFGVTLLFIFLPMSSLHSNLRGMILQRYMPVVNGGDRAPS